MWKRYSTYVCIMCFTVYTSFIIDPLYAKYMCALHICTHPLYFMYSLLQHRIRIFRKLLHMFSDVQKLTKRITSFLSPQSHHDQNDLSKWGFIFCVFREKLLAWKLELGFFLIVAFSIFVEMSYVSNKYSFIFSGEYLIKGINKKIFISLLWET